jgi:hypothetical protein
MAVPVRIIISLAVTQFRLVKQVKVKVKQFRYRPEWARGFQEVKFPRFNDNGTGQW